MPVSENILYTVADFHLILCHSQNVAVIVSLCNSQLHLLCIIRNDRSFVVKDLLGYVSLLCNVVMYIIASCNIK